MKRLMGLMFVAMAVSAVGCSSKKKQNDPILPYPYPTAASSTVSH